MMDGLDFMGFLEAVERMAFAIVFLDWVLKRRRYVEVDKEDMRKMEARETCYQTIARLACSKENDN